jgi:hypothetical protein
MDIQNKRVDEMGTIEYNGHTFMIRMVSSIVGNTFDADGKVVLGTVTVATTELLDAMQERYNEVGTIEEQIDSDITFYVKPEELGLPLWELYRIIEPDYVRIEGSLDLPSLPVVVTVPIKANEADGVNLLEEARDLPLSEVLAQNGIDYGQARKLFDLLGLDINDVETVYHGIATY